MTNINTSPSVDKPHPHSDPTYRAMLYEESVEKLNKIRNLMLFLGGIQIVMGFIFYSQGGPYAKYDLIAQAIIGAIFIGLALAVRKNPRSSVFAGLILYCLLIIGSFLLDPDSIVMGIPAKVVIIVLFARAIKTANDVVKLKSELAIYDESTPIDLVN